MESKKLVINLDKHFNKTMINLEQVRDDLMSIIRLVRYSDPKSWKVGQSGGQDSYAGLPAIMRTIDTELKKRGINLIEETK